MEDLTKGSIPRHLVRLSSFLAVTMVLQAAYFLVDLYFVARIGGAAIAGVGLSGNLMMIVLALTQMLGVGTTSLIAQAAGRRDPADAQAVFDQSCILSVAAGLFVLAAGMWLRVPYCQWLAADQATVEAGAAYLSWLIPSFALQFAMVSMGSALRATGVVKPTMFVQVLTVGLNAALAPVLIAGWGTGRPLGAAGAGLATFVAVAVGVVALAYVFLADRRFVRLHPAGWRQPRFDVWKRMIAIGLPAGGEFVIHALYSALVYWIVRGKGADAQAGFGVGARLMQALFIPVMAVSFGAAPLAAQNYGAKLGARVRATFRAGAMLAAGIMLPMTIVCQWAPESLVRTFSQEPEVVANGVEFLRIASWGFVAYGLTAAASGMFQAMGNTWPALASSAARFAAFTAGSVMVTADNAFALRDLWYVALAVGLGQTALSLTLLRRQFRIRLAFPG